MSSSTAPHPGPGIDSRTGLPDAQGILAWGEEHADWGQFTALVIVVASPCGSEESIGAAAEVLEACVRETDLVARYAEDALAVVTLGVDAMTADRIRDRIADELGVRDGRAATDVPLRAFIGMASYFEPGPAALDDLLRRADALCRAQVASTNAA